MTSAIRLIDHLVAHELEANSAEQALEKMSTTTNALTVRKGFIPANRRDPRRSVRFDVKTSATHLF